ncbi:MAG: prolipoprotein diacylglyceryl transferase [Candidatus Limivicinus sp.]|nr:prolipoprotein diacylglyceryl transferase [Candidatus Limivicinus sp.]
MNPIAVYSGSTVLFWSSIVIFLGLAASLFLSLALHRANGGRTAAMLLFLPLAVVLSVPICRVIHWYCHLEQYSGFIGAITEYSTGSYCLPGALPGCWLAAVIVKALGFETSKSRLLDAFAPGAALAVAFIRLSALFNNSCRSKISVTTPLLQHLPLASGVTASTGAVEYRFATFFVEFIIMMAAAWVLLRFFCLRRHRPMKLGGSDGNTARYFLLLYCAAELLLDSTRYDSSFMKFNGFVSIVQIICAICILALLIHYSRISVRANGLCARHWLMWAGWLLTLAATGISEYLVQRHGNWYLGCYAAMTASCALMAFIVYRMYLSCCAAGAPGTVDAAENLPA